MAGQRTRIRFGAVSAEVVLEKTASKPRGAQHETRRVLVEPSPLDAEALAAGRVEPEREGGAVPATDPFGDPVAAPEHDATFETPDGPMVVDHKVQGEGLPPGLLGSMGDPTWPPRDERLSDPVDGPFDPTEYVDRPEPREAPVPDADAAGGPGSRVERQAAESIDLSAATPEARAERVRRGLETPDGEVIGLTAEEAAREPGAQAYTPPATRVEQGVHLEDGTWVDLTDRLAEIDTRTKVDGLEVVRTIPAGSYASERVRDAHYVAGVDPDTYKTLALLWRALRVEGRAAEVRWTKRTAQASGIIVARGELPSANRPRPATPAHLLLLELEWAENVKRVPPRVRGPITAEVSVDEVAAAIELVQEFAAQAPRVELRDERLAKRVELLELARAGRLAEYEPPAEPMPETFDAGAEDLAAALALSAAWVREHAPA